MTAIPHATRPRRLLRLAGAPALVLCLASGALDLAVVPAGAVPARHSPRPADPYSRPGLAVRLPGGGQVHLVWPGKPARSAPGGPRPGAGAPGPAGTPTAATPTSGTPVGGAPVGARPTTGPGAGAPPAGGADLTVPLPPFPIPVLGPLFSGTSGAVGRNGPAAHPPTGSGETVSARPAGPGTGADAAGAAAPAPSPSRTRAPRPADPLPPAVRRGWRPVGEGPPPLGPQALVPPGAGRDALDAGRADAARAARGTIGGRLLPLGVGLALMGVGVALFGWKLRRM
ncbi:hypothetical protein [Streptacidiphilus sp. EB129]|uniref:hypothetical protein n=1 Tax=Streptacidiphilus sp. EB129 TaxID=3156262 RepID=UPI00351124F0